MNVCALISEALLAREKAYCPYSGFAVGAALLAKDGRIFRGCNVESVSHTPTCCAERTAFFKAVSEGVQEFEAIAIVAGEHTLKAPLPDYVSPCGVCRQVMVEFCEQDFKVILGRSTGDYQIYDLEQVMPLSFSGKSLRKD